MVLRFSIGIKLMGDKGRFYVHLPADVSNLEANREPFIEAMERIRIAFSTDTIQSIYITNQMRKKIETICAPHGWFALTHTMYEEFPFPFKRMNIDMDKLASSTFDDFVNHVAACKTEVMA